ncbi:hypothetical protein DFS33DRAFT_1345435 [Desarmillaria ectypa]|nr:hypothetical protein DFS33DRAFT_1345435 [Desarmillaria ectypa]
MDNTDPLNALKRGGSGTLVASTSPKHARMDVAFTASASTEEHDPSPFSAFHVLLQRGFEKEVLLVVMGLVIVQVATQYKKRHPKWLYKPIKDLDLLQNPLHAEMVYKDVIAIGSSENPKWSVQACVHYAIERTGSPTIKQPDNVIMTAIQNYLSKFSQTMLDVITGDKDLLRWDGPSDSGEHGDFFRRLCLPQVLGHLSLLLHELGCYNKEVFDKHLKSLFNVHNKSIVLINTSGSGKSRLLLEGLAIQENDGFNSDPISMEDFDSNEAIACRQYLKVLLACIFVFTHFLNLNLNIFCGIINILKDSTNDYLERSLRQSLEDVKNLLAQTFPLSTSSCQLCCIVDEAQAPAIQASNAFHSHSSRSSRSLLRPLTECLHKSLALHNWFLFLSGTGTNLQIIQENSGSKALKLGGESKFEQHSEMGSFEDADSQAAYIRKFVPPALQGGLSDFLAHVFTWTRGRFRFTATLIELLLISGFCSPYAVLNSYIKFFCDDEFEPGDAEDLIKAEPPLSPNIFIEAKISRGINVKHLSKLGVFSKLKENLPACLLIGTPLSVLPVDDSILVKLGFSRFVDITRSVHMDEPLVLTAIFTWLEKNEPGYLHTHIMEKAFDISLKHNPSEVFSAYAVFRALQSGLPLNQVLDFYIPENAVLPSWTYEKAQIVVPSHFDHTTQRYHTIPYSYSSRNIPQAGSYLDSASQLLQWLTFQGAPYSICYPITRAGPDLVCLVKLDSGKHFWLLGQTKVRESDKTIVNGDLVSAVQSVIPENVYRNSSGAEVDGLPAASQQFLKALDALPDKVDKVLSSDLASHHAIGVLCIFPAFHNIQCLNASSFKTTTTPLAAINWDRVGPILDNIMLGSKLWAQLIKRSHMERLIKVNAQNDDSHIDYKNVDFIVDKKDLEDSSRISTSMLKLQLQLHRLYEQSLPSEQRKVPEEKDLKTRQDVVHALEAAIDRWNSL